MADPETNPLLASANGEDDVSSQEAQESPHLKPDRAVENDVLPETATVGRRIGWASAYILVISRVIGSGIFAMPGTVVQTVGSPGLALILWVAGTLVAWAGLAIDIELGTTLPRSGGMKVYLEFIYRRPRFFASTMVAVQAVLLGFTATNCIVFAKYTLFALKIEPTDLTTKILAIGMLSAITVIHSCFYKTGIWIQNILGWLKIFLIIFMVLTGCFVLILRPRESSFLETRSTPTWWHDIWQDSDWALNNLSTAFFKVL